MKNGNWIPIDKTFADDLPRNREFTKLEAAFSLSLDYDNNSLVTVSGYSSLWGWSRKRVNNFLDSLGVEIKYPENTKNRRNQKGHIALHKRDIKGTYKGHKRIIDSKCLADEKNIKGTYKEHKRNIKGSTTIYPISYNPNPEPKNKSGFSVAFERWWESYPARNGRKRGKKAAFIIFDKIKVKDWTDLKTATSNYSVECGGLPKDAERFLRNDFWKEYLTPNQYKADSDKRHGKPRQSEKSFDELAAEMRRDGEL